jgi:transcriptional regulator with XRE-family HTH domain
MKGKRGTKTAAKNGRVRTDLSVQIGKAAREARLRKKLTQADVAERVKLTDEVYGRIERGDMTPSTPTLIKLCTVLGLRATTFKVGMGVLPSKESRRGSRRKSRGGHGATSEVI